MAIDPSISLGVRPPQIAIPEIQTPLERFGKILTLQNLMRQGQMGDIQLQTGQMQLEQARQAQRDDQILRQAYIESAGDLEKTKTLLMQRGGSPTALFNLQNQQLETRKKLAEIDEKLLPGLKDQHDRLYALTNQAMKMPDADYIAAWPTLRQSALAIDPKLQLPLDPIPKANLPAFAAQYGTSSAALAQEVDRRAAEKERSEALTRGMKNAAKTIDLVKSAADYPAWRAKQEKPVQDYLPLTVDDANLPLVKGSILRMGVDPDVFARETLPQGEFERMFLPAFAAKLKTTPDQLTPDQKIQAFREYKTDPTQQQLANAQKLMALMQARMQLNQMPTQEQADQLADALIKHQFSPEQMNQLIGGYGAQGGALKRMITLSALKRDPDFNFEQATAEYQLTKSPQFQNTVRYMDSVVESLPQLIDRAQKLGNFGIRSVNELLNRGKEEFNNINLKRFNTDRLLLADEVAKILQGGGTGSGTSDAKLHQAEQIFRSTDDPSAIRAAAEEVTQLIGNRRRALTRGTYFERIGPAVFQPVSDEVKKVLSDPKYAPGKAYPGNDGNWYKKNADGTIEIMIAPPQK
jgi:hypothetical protein